MPEPKSIYWDIEMYHAGRSQGYHGWANAEKVAVIVEKCVDQWGAENCHFEFRRSDGTKEF